jgi:5'(3')-deoxyribonucleotidase
MSRKVIAVDIDDVLADSTEALRLIVNERTGASLSRDDYMSTGEYWDYYEQVWARHGLSDKFQYSDIEKELALDQSYVPLLPGAVSAVRELNKRYDIVLITSRNTSWEDATRRWCKDYIFDHDINLFFTGSRHDSDYKPKGQLCKQLGVSILIDDNPTHCRSAIEEGVEALLFGSYGWHYDIPEQAVRCKDWPTVLEYFNNAG